MSTRHRIPVGSNILLCLSLSTLNSTPCTLQPAPSTLTHNLCPRSRYDGRISARPSPRAWSGSRDGESDAHVGGSPAGGDGGLGKKLEGEGVAGGGAGTHKWGEPSLEGLRRMMREVVSRA